MKTEKKKKEKKKTKKNKKNKKKRMTRRRRRSPKQPQRLHTTKVHPELSCWFAVVATFSMFPLLQKDGLLVQLTLSRLAFSLRAFSMHSTVCTYVCFSEKSDPSHVPVQLQLLKTQITPARSLSDTDTARSRPSGSTPSPLPPPPPRRPQSGVGSSVFPSSSCSPRMPSASHSPRCVKMPTPPPSRPPWPMP